LRIIATYTWLAASLLALSSFFAPGNGEEKLFTVKGRITRTYDYCGGAYIPQAMEQGRRPVAYPHKTIYVKRGIKNELKEEIVDSTTTDENGRFALKLPAGKYCIIEQYKTEKLVMPPNDSYTTYDSDCVRMKWTACDYDLIVKDKDVDSIFFNYHQSCSFSQPCQNYHGPLPPAAAH
jgi:hypothetical protein